MKFSLFVHMERLDASQSHKSLYEEFVALCEIADKGGMHAIWTGEHHGMDFTIAPNPFVTIADLARRTSRARLGTGTVIAPFWHPIKLAGEAAMADIICDGRLDIGIARGAYSFEYERLLPGLDAWGAGQRMRELIPAVKGIWAGDYAHDGNSSSSRRPRPRQNRCSSRTRPSGLPRAIRTRMNLPSPTAATFRSRPSGRATTRFSR